MQGLHLCNWATLYARITNVLLTMYNIKMYSIRKQSVLILVHAVGSKMWENVAPTVVFKPAHNII